MSCFLAAGTCSTIIFVPQEEYLQIGVVRPKLDMGLGLTEPTRPDPPLPYSTPPIAVRPTNFCAYFLSECLIVEKITKQYRKFKLK